MPGNRATFRGHLEGPRERAHSPGRAIPDDIEEFLREHRFDGRATESFLAEPLEVQRMVVERGSLLTVKNPSAGLIGRIRDAKEAFRAGSGGHPPGRGDGVGGGPPSGQRGGAGGGAGGGNSAVEGFIRVNDIDPQAAATLCAEPLEVQNFVLSRGGLSQFRNPSAELIGRIREAEELFGLTPPAAAGGRPPPPAGTPRPRVDAGGGSMAPASSVRVRGFDFDTPEGAIAAHFSEVGTVRRCVLKNKGVALVTFNTPQEAQRAVERLHETTIEGNERFIQVFHDDANAKKRRAQPGGAVPSADRPRTPPRGPTSRRPGGPTSRPGVPSARPAPAPLAPAPPPLVQSRPFVAPTPLRQAATPRPRADDGGGNVAPTPSVRIYGFDFGTPEGAIRAHLSEVGTVRRCVLKGKGMAIVTFDTPQEAQRAVERLHETTIEGNERLIKIIFHDEAIWREKHGRTQAVHSSRNGTSQAPPPAPAPTKRKAVDDDPTFGTDATPHETFGRRKRRMRKRIRLTPWATDVPAGCIVYVQNVDFDAQHEVALEHFRQVGQVLEMKPVTRGSGAVAFSERAEAEEAVRGLDGTTLDGGAQPIRVSWFRPRHGEFAPDSSDPEADAATDGEGDAGCVHSGGEDLGRDEDNDADRAEEAEDQEDNDADGEAGDRPDTDADPDQEAGDPRGRDGDEVAGDPQEADASEDMDADEAAEAGAGGDVGSEREGEPADGAPPEAHAWADAAAEAWRLFCAATPGPGRTLGALLRGFPADAQQALRSAVRRQRGDRGPPAGRAGRGPGGKGRASGGGGKGGRSHGGGWDRRADGKQWKGSSYGRTRAGSGSGRWQP